MWVQVGEIHYNSDQLASVGAAVYGGTDWYVDITPAGSSAVHYGGPYANQAAAEAAAAALVSSFFSE